MDIEDPEQRTWILELKLQLQYKDNACVCLFVPPFLKLWYPSFIFVHLDEDTLLLLHSVNETQDI